MLKFLVVFSHGDRGWRGEVCTAAKRVEASSPEAAISAVKLLASEFYENTGDFRCLLPSKK